MWLTAAACSASGAAVALRVLPARMRDIGCDPIALAGAVGR